MPCKQIYQNNSKGEERQKERESDRQEDRERKMSDRMNENRIFRVGLRATTIKKNGKRSE